METPAGAPSFPKPFLAEKLSFDQLFQLAEQHVAHPSEPNPLRDFLEHLPACYMDTVGQISRALQRRFSTFPGLNRILDRPYAASTKTDSASADAERLEARFNALEPFILDECLGKWGGARFLPGDHVGELGCGGGPILRALARRYPEVATWRGFDFSQGSLDFAETKKHDGLATHAPYKRLSFHSHNLLRPLPHRGFNTLFTHQVWQYFSKPEARQMTHHAHEALIPGGRLIVVDQIHNSMLKGFSPHLELFLNQAVRVAEWTERFDAHAGSSHNDLMWNEFSEVQSHIIPYPQYSIPHGQIPDAYTQAYLIYRLLRSASLAPFLRMNLQDFRVLCVQFYDELMDPKRCIEGPQISITSGIKPMRR